MPEMTLAELADRTGGRVVGDGNVSINGAAPLSEAGEMEISFLANESYQKDLLATTAGAVIMQEAYLERCPVNALIHSNPYLCFARVLELLFPQTMISQGLAPTAVIHPTCDISSSASVHAHSVIEADVVIGDNVNIGPGCVISHGTRIASGSRLVANVTVYPGVHVGHDCLIHAGCVIGSDGFGIANEHGHWVKVPQIGGLRIGDNVEIGANTTIDRGSLRDTVIGNGVKMDNQIQIAHNVIVGEHTAIAACVGIAGSTTIGKHCSIGGAAGIVGHLVIGDGATINAKTFVTRSLAGGETYSSGFPAMPTATWRRIVGRIRMIDQLFNRVKKLEKERTESH